MAQNATDLIIIGASVAGLAAGCYSQLYGYRSQIFEYVGAS
jgi:thioredoxin reductase